MVSTPYPAQNTQPINPSPLPVRPAPFERPELLLSWQAPARAHLPKTESYFAALAILSLALALLIFLALGDFILALLVLSLGLAIYALNRVEPPQVDFGIYTTHLALDQKKCPYRDLNWFWISKTGEQNQIHLSTSLNFPPRLLLTVPDELLPQAQEALLRYLPYHEEKETVLLTYLDQILTYLAPRLPASAVELFKKLEKQAPRLLPRRLKRKGNSIPGEIRTPNL